MWDEHNRPWDYDHVIPQDWIHQKGSWRKKYTDYCKAWLNCNGNFAAIPFEKNRGKSNHAEWNEYITNKKELLCDEDIEKFEQLFDKNIQTNQEQAYRFVVKTKDRTIKIYQECHKLLNRVFENGTFEMLSSHSILAKRKNIIKSLLSILGNQARVYFTYSGEDYEVMQDIEWAMPELTIGVTTGEKMACLYFHCSDDLTTYNYWIGIGKAPGVPKKQEREIRSFKDYQIRVDDEWWYLCKEFEKETPIEELSVEINILVKFLNTK